MLARLVSRDYPGAFVLTVAVWALLLSALGAPFFGAGLPVLNLFVKIAIYTILAASFDLMLGYTGIISFAHTMFYGIGAYGIALALRNFGAGWWQIGMGLVAAAVTAVLLALMIGLFSLRVRAIFFAMITLAVATTFSAVITQFHEITGGQDGLLYHIPRELTPAFRPIPGHSTNGTVLSYFGILFICSLLFVLMLRLVNSPFGRVLQALRENEFRAEALGFSVVKHRLWVSAIAACFACIVGGLNAIWLRFISPDITLNLQVMLDILIIVVIGGMGTLYGALVGASLFFVAEDYLKQAITVVSDSVSNVPVISIIAQPERWMLWLGIMFVIIVYYFPDGIVGRLRSGARWKDR
jgi:branched-chain amino acid transport system permease protein